MKKLKTRMMFKLILFTILTVLLLCYKTFAADMPTRTQLLDPLWLCCFLNLLLAGGLWKSINGNINTIIDEVKELQVDNKKLCRDLNELRGAYRVCCGGNKNEKANN